MKHLCLIVTKECKFETILCRFKQDCAWVGGVIKAVYCLAFDAHKINRVVESVYDAMIAICICQLVYADG